jgi:hypothetical protein
VGYSIPSHSLGDDDITGSNTAWAGVGVCELWGTVHFSGAPSALLFYHVPQQRSKAQISRAKEGTSQTFEHRVTKPVAHPKSLLIHSLQRAANHLQTVDQG